MSEHLYNVTIKKLPKSEIEITASIPSSEFDATRGEAIKHLKEGVELPGFRKGHVPDKIIEQKVGEAVILEEMAEIAIRHAYPKIILAEKIDALGRPEVRINKIAMGNPLEFTLVTAVFPELTLPDYKKLSAKVAKEKDEIVVTDDEVTKTIEQFQRMRAKQDGQETQDAEGKDIALPPLDDAAAKEFGDFNTVEDFKAKLRENILAEKTREAKDKKRVRIMEAIIDAATIELPEIIIAQELARMEDEFAHEIERMGMTLDAYMKATQKTKEDMHKDWRADGEKRAKVQLITSKIAQVEKIEPEKERLDKEVAALRARYPEAEADRIEGYVTMLLMNEKVFEFLESQTV